jgi:hypothetical protein
LIDKGLKGHFYGPVPILGFGKFFHTFFQA